MIFPKQFLADALESKILKTSHQTHPWETLYKNGNKSPFDLIMMNYFTHFDLKTNEMKDMVHKARKEITNTCFNEDDMSVVPNAGKIEECIKRVNHKVYGKQLEKRNVYFGNIFYNYEQEIKNVPESISGESKIKKHVEITEKLIWDAFKSKYYFSEKFAI